MIAAMIVVPSVTMILVVTLLIVIVVTLVIFVILVIPQLPVISLHVSSILILSKVLVNLGDIHVPSC
jgi:hypothetical protein